VYSREQISSELSNKLSDIIVTLIEIFALSTKAIKGGRLLKFTRNVLLGSDDKIQSSVSKLDRLTETEASLVGAETLTESKRTGRMVDDMSVTVTSTNVTVQETGQAVSQMSLEVTDVRETLGDVLLKVNELSELKEEAKTDQEKKHHDLVKKALQPSKTNAPQDWYDKINKSRVPSTGDWIRGEDVFKSWIGKDVPIVFISGNPGAGKSFLSSNIIAFLREQHPQGVQHPSHVSVGYFFFKDDNPSTRSFHQAFRDLAYQISQNDPVYQKYLSSTVEDYESISTIESAWRILFVDYFLIDKYGDSSVYMLFDGVDEAFETERQIFFSLVKDIHDAGHHARIQLAMVGRPQLVDQIVEALELESEREMPTIHVTSLKNSDDIERYIKSSIQKSVILRRVSPKLREEIVEKLSSGAQGMFIWVDLMLKELLKKRNESSMRKSLKQAPNGLKEMLRHVLESFSASSNEEELDYLNELLAWIACALRPFKLGEIETILRLKSPEGEGMIYLEGMLRKQFASFFTLNRDDGLTTAELQNPHRYKDDSDDQEEEGEKREAFEDVENETDFDSNKETTEVTFCHASIGDFLRDENQGKVSAGDGHIPIGVDYHDGKVHVLKTCLRLLCDLESMKKFEGTTAFTQKYVCEYWPVHLRSIELSRVKLEDRKEIASTLAKMFSQEDFMEPWTDLKAWHCSNESLKLVRQWWEDKEVVDSLHQEERDFVTLTSSSPATTFKPLAMIYAKKWLDQQKSPMYCVAAIVSYSQFENGTNLNSTGINLKPTAKETIDAAEWTGKEKTAIWYRRVALVLRVYGHYDEALEYFLKSDQMDPNDCLTKTGLAKLYVLQKQWRKAIELDQKTEQVLLKRIGEEPDKENQHRILAHEVQERIGDSYGQLKDKENRFASFKRAFVNKPDCGRCINVIIFHNNDQRLYKDTVDMLKKLQGEEVAGKEYSRLTATLWENPYGGASYFYDCADAARKTNELDFLVEAYREAIRAAKKEAKNIIASWLELSLAKLYKEYVGDEKKAVRTWERIVDTYGASKEEDEIGEVKQVASEFLATHLISEAVNAGIGSAEAEKQGKRLEELVRKKTTSAKEAMSWIPANAPALILGLWYRLSGRQEEADACFRPSIKEAIQILSDDDPENDIEGLFELQNALLVAGDESNVLAIAYYLGVYKDDEPGIVSAKEGEKGEGRTSQTEDGGLNDDANGASKEKETDDDQDENSNFGYYFGVPDEDLRITCDGPCRRDSTVEDKFYVCRYCIDISFCEDCVKLLEEVKLPIHICNPKHAKDFFFIPPRPQKVEKGKMLVDGKIVGFEEWRDSLKKQWKV
jgi:tetratricopeptide (TPR) repeat protein